MSVEERLEKFAEKHGLMINKDLTCYYEMIRHIENVEEKTGLLICPCTIPGSGPITQLNQRCPCPQGINDTEKNGSCHCGLLTKWS